MNSSLLSSPSNSQLIAVNRFTGRVDSFDWKSKTFELTRELGTQLPQSTLGGRAFLAGAFNGEVNVWRLSDKASPRHFIVDNRPPVRLSVTQREHPEDWNPLPAEGSGTRTVGPNRAVEMYLSASGGWLAWGKYDGTVTIWNTSGRGYPVQLSDAASSVQAVATADNTAFQDSFVAAAGSDRHMYLWSLRSGSLTKVLTGLSGDPQAVSFSSDGTRLNATSQFTVVGWDVGTGKSLERWQVPVENATKRFVFASALDSRRGLLGLGMNDGYVDVWDTLHHRRIDQVGNFDPVLIGADTGGGRIDRVVFGNSGTLVAFGKQYGLLEVWNFKTHQRLAQERCNGMTMSLAFSHDDRYLICGSESGVVAWDLQGKEPPRNFLTTERFISSIAVTGDSSRVIAGAIGALVIWDFHSGRIIDVVRTSDRPVALSLLGRGFVVSLNEDATVGLYGISSAVLLAKCVSRGQDDWLTFTSDGFFDGTSSAWKRSDFHSSLDFMSFFELERFFSQFYQPGLVSTLVSEGQPIRNVLVMRNDPRAAAKIERLKTSQLPKVTFESPKVSNVEVSARSISVLIEARDTGSGVEGCRLFRNGILVHHSNERIRQTGVALRVSADVTVTAGPNHLRAYCFNDDGLKSLDVTISVTGSQSLFQEGRAYILAVGVNQYSDVPLSFAVADAEAVSNKVASLLSAASRFGPAVAIVLRDEEATTENILWVLRRLSGDKTLGPAPSAIRTPLTTAGPEDAVVIFFAGHGSFQGEHYYLVPYGGGKNISETDLDKALENIDAGHLALIVDACESAGILSENIRAGPINASGLAQLAYEKGGYILAASQNDQPAREFPSLGHGLLSSVLLKEALTAIASGPSAKEATMAAWLSAAVSEVPLVQRHLPEFSVRRDVSSTPASDGFRSSGSYQVPYLFFRRDGDEVPFPIGRVILSK
jgi:WD40 repeat protein